MHFLLPNFIRFVFFWLKDGGNKRAKMSFNNNQTPAGANKTKKKKIPQLVNTLRQTQKSNLENNRTSNDILFSLELGENKQNKNF